MPRLEVIVPYSSTSKGAAADAAQRLLGLSDVGVVLAGPGGAHADGARHLDGVEGLGAAIKAALPQLSAPVTVVYEPDPAWSPDTLDALAAPIERDEADVVIAAREHLTPLEQGLAVLARLAAQVRLRDPLSGLKAFRTQVLREVNLSAEGDQAGAELLVKLAAQLYRFQQVELSARPLRRGPRALFSLGRTLLRYATTQNDADNEHEGYNTLARMEEGAPNYNQWLGDRFREHAGARVLEVGAGIGTITAELAAGREKVVALEVDDFYVRRLKNRFRAVGNVEPYLSDVALADTPRLKAERFDTIVLSNVLEHIEDDAGAVRHFEEILGPGGRVLVLVPALPLLFGALDEAVGHHRRYTPATLRKVLEENGFEVEKLEWMNLVGVPGWFVNGRLLRRRAMPPLQLRLYDQLAPALARRRRG